MKTRNLFPAWRERLYRLTDEDLRFLVSSYADRRTDHDHIMELVRDKPDFIDVMLEEEKVFQALVADPHVLVRVSPLLLFNVYLRRAKRQLREVGYVTEINGRLRIPLFATGNLREILDDDELRDYLAEMLASFVRTNTGTVYFHERGTWRKRTFSDLNSADLMAMAQWVPEHLRFPLYKRSADACLFIVGVFPENVAAKSSRTSAGGAFQEYEESGMHLYKIAASHSAANETGYRRVLEEIARRISDVRLLLNFVAAHILGSSKSLLFGWGQFLPAG